MRPLSSLLARRRPSPQARTTSGRHFKPVLELLEERTVPSIVWVNRGTASDTFTPAEHAVIDRAIQLWGQRLVLNRTIDVTFTGGSTSSLDLGPGVLGETTNVFTDSNGSSSADIAIDASGGGAGWFIDPTPQDNAEYTPTANPSDFVNGPARADLLTTVTHELGHALGLVTSPTLAAHLSPLGGNQFLFQAADGYQAQVEADGEGIHLPANVYLLDLMNPVQRAGDRSLPSDDDVRILSETYGYRLNNGTITPPHTELVSGPGTFDPTTATWYLRDSNSPGAPDIPPFSYGGPGWTPLAGDWDGDGITTIGAFDPAAATFYLRNTNSAGAPDIVIQFGRPGWIPVVGDWNGTGVTAIGVVDPATMTWFLRFTNTPGAPDAVFPFGAPGWVPVTGDWDGNGTTTVGAFDPSSATWYLRNSNSPGATDFAPFSFGAPGWKPVVGNWDGQGPDTVGVVDPTTATWYLRNSNGPGFPDIPPFSYGAGGWTPLGGHWGAVSTTVNSGGTFATLTPAAPGGGENLSGDAGRPAGWGSPDRGARLDGQGLVDGLLWERRSHDRSRALPAAP